MNSPDFLFDQLKDQSVLNPDPLNNAGPVNMGRAVGVLALENGGYGRSDSVAQFLQMSIGLSRTTVFNPGLNTVLLLKNYLIGNSSYIQIGNDKDTIALMQSFSSATNATHFSNSTNNAVFFGSGTGGALSIMMVGTQTNVDFVLGTNDLERIRILGTGGIGFGVTAPTAVLHLKGGTATANTSPLKFNAGTNLTVVENGAMEFDGTNFFLSAGGVRNTILMSSTGVLGVANGGTGLSASPANGQLLIGNGTGYTLATLTAGTGVTITNAAGSITVAIGQAVATSSSPQFANLIITNGGDIRPSADATTAIGIGNAVGTDYIKFDTTNSRMMIGSANAPATTLHVTNAVGGATAEIARFYNTGAQLGRGMRIMGSSGGFIGIQGALSSNNADDYLVLQPSSLSVIIGANAALLTTATDGFLYIPTSAGIPTGIPTAFTGKAAMQFDVTNNKLDIYNATAGAWKTVLLV